MAKKNQGGKKAPLIQINAGKGRFDWITKEQLKKRIAKGESFNITARSIDKVSNTDLNKLKRNEKRFLPKEEEAKPPKHRGIPKRTGKSDTTEPGEKKESKGRKEEPTQENIKRRVKAPEIEYNKAALRELRNTVRNQKGQFLKREDYEEILKREKAGEDLTDVLQDIADQNPDIKVIMENTEETFYFQTGNFIDRLSEEAGELKERAKIIIVDFDGVEHTHTSPIEAQKHMKELNGLIDSAVRSINKDIEKERPELKGKKAGVYISIPETVKSDSNGNVIGIRYDYEDLKVSGSDFETFNDYLQAEMLK